MGAIQGRLALPRLPQAWHRQASARALPIHDASALHHAAPARSQRLMSGQIKSDPMTHYNGHAPFSWCKCEECGTVAICTPDFQFYAKAPKGVAVKGAPIICSECVLKYVPKQILQMSIDLARYAGRN